MVVIGNTDSKRVTMVISMEQAREIIAGLHLRHILADNPDTVIAITDNDKPVMALVPWESWVEDNDLAAGMESMETVVDLQLAATLIQS